MGGESLDIVLQLVLNGLRHRRLADERGRLGYWVAFAGAVAVVALFGAVLDAGVLRRVLGQPQFAVVMLTIGLAAVFRSFASIVWGTEIYTLPTPFSTTFAASRCASARAACMRSRCTLSMSVPSTRAASPG